MLCLNVALFSAVDFLCVVHLEAFSTPIRQFARWSRFYFAPHFAYDCRSRCAFNEAPHRFYQGELHERHKDENENSFPVYGASHCVDVIGMRQENSQSSAAAPARAKRTKRHTGSQSE
jgi:hypothetical protein